MSEIDSHNAIEMTSPQADKTIVICIPAYNEAINVANIIQKASKYASEVIVYDDGSQDNTCEIAKSSGADRSPQYGQ